MTYLLGPVQFVGKFPIRTDLADHVEPCPVCGEDVIDWNLARHCRKKNDPNHLALEVMET